MKNILKIIMVVTVVAALSSCLGHKKTTIVSNRPMNADLVRLDLKMEDFQFLGEEKLTIIYRKYLGVFTVIDSINNIPWERRNTKLVQFNTFSPFNGLLSRAMAPIVEKYPETDFVNPVYTIEESSLNLGGSKNKLLVKVKMYKFKN